MKKFIIIFLCVVTVLVLTNLQKSYNASQIHANDFYLITAEKTTDGKFIMHYYSPSLNKYVDDKKDSFTYEIPLRRWHNKIGSTPFYLCQNTKTKKIYKVYGDGYELAMYDSCLLSKLRNHHSNKTEIRDGYVWNL